MDRRCLEGSHGEVRTGKIVMETTTKMVIRGSSGGRKGCLRRGGAIVEREALSEKGWEAFIDGRAEAIQKRKESQTRQGERPRECRYSPSCLRLSTVYEVWWVLWVVRTRRQATP